MTKFSPREVRTVRVLNDRIYWWRRAAVVTVIAGVCWFGASTAPAGTPQRMVEPTVYPNVIVVDEPKVGPNQLSTSTTAAFVYPQFLCDGWVRYAHGLGWDYEDLNELDYMLWRESRCDPTVHNTTLNDDGSSDIGLAQINDKSWCLPTRWYPQGYLPSLGVVSDCQDLFNPTLNLVSALVIFNYSLEMNGNGWQPWGLQKDFCDSSTATCDATVIVGG